MKKATFNGPAAVKHGRMSLRYISFSVNRAFALFSHTFDI